MILGDGPLGFTIDGKGFPATQPIAAKLGQKVLGGPNVSLGGTR